MPTTPTISMIRFRRRACMYVAVLGAALLITVLGMGALLAARVEGRSAVTESDIAEARRCAAAGLELGRYAISSSTTWRSRGAGSWYLNQAIGKGSFTLAVTDPADGNLANTPYGSAQLTSTGVKGGATQVLSVTLSPQTLGWDCLDSGVHAGGAVVFTTATVWSDRMVGTNSSMAATSSTIQSNVEAVGTITGSTYAKSTSTGITARTMPDSTAFDSYIASGVTLGSIPSGGGKKTIQKCVLSPNSNPFSGGLSASGIYIVDAGGSQLIIQNCRIYGTLVVLNPGAGSTVTGSVRWDATGSALPALLVRGDFTVATSQTQLSEATQSTNFNPTGTPYSGTADSDTTDSYPSSITGLVYISGNASFQGYNTINGVAIVGGTLQLIANSTTGIAARLDLNYNSAFYASPPAGFAAPTKMVMTSAGITQVTN